MTETIEAYRDAENSKDLFTGSMLQSVHNAITSYIQAPITQYAQDPATWGNQLTSAADAIDTVYDALATWPALSLRGRTIAAGQAANQYITAAEKALTGLHDEAARLQEEVDEFKRNFHHDIVDLNSTSAEKMAQVKAEADSSIENVKLEMSALELTMTEYRTNLETLQTQTEATLDDKLSKSEEWLTDKLEYTIEEALDSLSERTDSAVEKSEADNKQIASLLAEASTLTQETRNLAESFAKKAVANDFQQNALNKSVAGWIWDIIGLLSGTIPLGFVLYHFMTNDLAGESVAAVTTSRIGVSLAAVGVAALCFHRGSVNHKESRLAKRTALRVETVHPFLANLDPDVRKAVLEGMADQIYLRGILDPENKNDDSDAGNLLTNYLTDFLERKKAEGDKAEA